MQLGEKLFRFELNGSDGKAYNNFYYADRSALLIIITCNHCKYSRAYWSRIKKLYDRYEEDNLGIMCINPNDPAQFPDDSPANMAKVARELNIVFPYLFDESQEVAKKLAAQRTPEAYLFNSRRELVYRGAIDDCWDNEHMVTRVYLEDAIECTLDGIEVDYPEVTPVGCSIKWKPGNEPVLG